MVFCWAQGSPATWNITRPGNVFICVDNRASIRTIGNPSSKSGQHIVHKIVEEIKKLREEG